jgi:hypothetical protein
MDLGKRTGDVLKDLGEQPRVRRRGTRSKMTNPALEPVDLVQQFIFGRRQELQREARRLRSLLREKRGRLAEMRRGVRPIFIGLHVDRLLGEQDRRQGVRLRPQLAALVPNRSERAPHGRVNRCRPDSSPRNTDETKFRCRRRWLETALAHDWFVSFRGY